MGRKTYEVVQALGNGGGVLFRSLLEAGLVDTVEVAVMPVLLGSGIPLLPPGTATTLTLTDQQVLARSRRGEPARGLDDTTSAVESYG